MHFSIFNPTLLTGVLLITAASSAPSSILIPPSSITILGGVIPSNTLFPLVDTTPLIQFYSITNYAWTIRSSMPQGPNHANATAVNGKIYVLSGLPGIGEAGEGRRVWGAVADSWVYDPITGLWETIPGAPAGKERGSGAAVVSIFNTDIWTWLSVPEAAKYIPEARDHAGAAVIDAKMYTLGGRNSGQENARDTVFVLDLCDLEAVWKTSAAHMPTPRSGVAAGPIEKKVYVFGDEGNVQSETGVLNQVEVYDTT
ncbi:hypothetical protein G6011_06585 [Alternaria panax]|uniref:Galactose oxidase n=1 Tax=Alternaria panax TaxID=48097 RepID=A0AAD4I876_9PLEO|nr:hypothetical protein G6011_06585 [Alternaria panax]